MRLNPLRSAQVALSVSISLAIFPAHAQYEEVVVTAQKREESIQSVPVAISAFTGDTLLNLGVTGTQSLQAVTPGLVFTKTGPAAQPYIRGIGTRLASVGLEPSVAVYIDDRYEPVNSAMMFELADVERIEVLKGPQGTLYGRNATAGAIRVISKDVSDQLEGQIKATAGNYGLKGLSGEVNLPIADGLATRLSGMVKKRDGFASNLVAGYQSRIDDLDFMALRSKFRLELGDNVTTRLTLGYWKRDDSAGLAQVDLAPPGLNTGVARGGISASKRGEVATSLDPFNRIEQFSGEFRIDAELPYFDLVSITTYADNSSEVAIDADATSARVFDAPFSKTTGKNFSQEFQLVSNTAGELDWLLGSYYFHDKSQTESTLDLGAPTIFSIGDQAVKTDAFALFGQATWHIDERWDLTAGGRWSNEKKRATTDASTRVDGATLAFVPYADHKRWNSFTPKLTLQYNFDDAMVYLAYARGFKSGGYNYPAKSPAGVGAVLNPETLDMIELGAKGTFFDHRLRANAAAYYYDYKDLQVTRAASLASGGVAATTENAANANVYGLDVDLSWLVTDNLTLTSGFNLSHSEYHDFDATAKVYNAVITGTSAPGMSDVAYDADGKSLLRAPDWSAFVALEYDVLLGGHGHAPITVSYSYKDDYDFDFIADPSSSRLRQKGYGLWNARVSYVSADSHWRPSLWIENIANQRYFDDLVAAGAGIRGAYGAPRTYGVDLSYSF
jgi:iron complex outermembrane receptor protein